MSPWLEIILRFLLAAALGAIIGYQRERAGKVAGLRTHILVSSGASLFTLVSIYGFGAAAVDLIAEGKFGRLVIKKGEKIKSMPLEEVGEKLRLVPEDHKLIKKARGLDICFGSKR